MHRLGKRHLAQQAGEHVRQDVDRRLAAMLLAERQVRALRRLEPLERGDLDALFLGEADGCRRRLAAASNAADTGGPVSSSSKSV